MRCSPPWEAQARRLEWVARNALRVYPARHNIYVVQGRSNNVEICVAEQADEWFVERRSLPRFAY